MAPKGGRGGGGGGRGGSSVNISCSDGAFQTSQSKAIIAVAALFLLIFLVMGCLVPGSKARARKGLQPPGKSKKSWSVLGGAIWFQVLGTIMFIASIALTQCDPRKRAGVDLQMARLWFEGFAMLFIFGLILISVSKDLHKVSGSLLPKLVTVGHSGYLGLLVFLKLLSLVLLSVVGHPPESIKLDTYANISKAAKGITVVFDVLAMLGMLIAGVSLILAMIRGTKLGSAKLWVIVLVFASVAWTLIEFAFFAHFSLQTKKFSVEADVVYFVLRSLFFTITFLSILFILKTPSVANPGAPEGTAPAAPMAQAPQQQSPMGQQPGPNQPFNNNANAGYQPQYDQNNQPQYNQNQQLPYDPNYPPPPQNNAPYSAPYNNSNPNVNYTPVSAASPAPPQPYYNR